MTTAIAPRALYQEVAERLRSRIFAHELPPGSWIDEQALAETYGISRTPLREALKVLAAEGLVTLKPRRGCYVTELSEQDLDEIFPVMGLLEGRCAFEAATRASDADLRRLRAIHAQLEEAAAAGDIEGFFEVNQRFHAAVQELSGNRWLKQVIDDMRKVLKLNRHHSLFDEGRPEASLQEHRAILAALLAREPAHAEELMRRHLQSGREALARVLSAAGPAEVG
ncbi:MAG: GntR family transcriptional regulator [Betaproteobacteria bacterium]|nr:GntR family transcriptional regulator [Betaproteobacteria bacterium]